VPAVEQNRQSEPEFNGAEIAPVYFGISATSREIDTGRGREPIYTSRRLE
jgi:hypothetical protein